MFVWSSFHQEPLLGPNLEPFNWAAEVPSEPPPPPPPSDLLAHACSTLAACRCRRKRLKGVVNCGGELTLPLSLHSVRLTPGSLIVPAARSLASVRDSGVRPQSCRLRDLTSTRPPAAPGCRSRSNRPAFMTPILSVRVWHAAFCLLSFIHTHTHTHPHTGAGCFDTAQRPCL